ncbi:effector binding domain-containing protein [Halobacillus litoralis]|uniref:GyrI-like domain-containing protein n=1 Tax=Halobacillus litoralis TaxID=45668 RepID=UPI001CFE2A74|nr:effector binding domain-containing protein [Halobacillus litoralis]WLR46457.1 effector binding domain-containing protein [Halobacillus litoralis]
MEVNIVALPAFKVRGRKWEGSYEQVPGLKDVIKKVETEKEEINPVDPDYQWGLSVHTIENGFVHFSGFEVEDSKSRASYEEMNVPHHTYMTVHHPRGREIGETYASIYQWFRDGNAKPYLEPETNYYDGLPLKFEKYPVDRDFDEPHFDIYIPIQA